MYITHEHYIPFRLSSMRLDSLLRDLHPPIAIYKLFMTKSRKT